MSVTSSRRTQEAASSILELAGSPSISGQTPVLVLAVGLPGSGKSTFCRTLARKTGAAYLESDWFRTSLFVVSTYRPQESKILFQALYDAASQLIQKGASVIIDATNLREADRQHAYDVAEAARAEILVLHFRSPEHVIAKRLEQRRSKPDAEDRSTATIGVYMRMIGTEEPIRREHWQIDTSDDHATNLALEKAVGKLAPPRFTATPHDMGGTIS